MLTLNNSDGLSDIWSVDSNFAGCSNGTKSTSGFKFTLASGVLSWQSSKETLTTYSIMQDELVACFEVIFQEMWLKNLLSDIQVNVIF